MLNEPGKFLRPAMITGTFLGAVGLGFLYHNLVTNSAPPYAQSPERKLHQIDCIDANTPNINEQIDAQNNIADSYVIQIDGESYRACMERKEDTHHRGKNLSTVMLSFVAATGSFALLASVGDILIRRSRRKYTEEEPHYQNRRYDR